MVYLGRSVYVTLRRVRVTIVAVEKAISIAYSQRVSLALVMRHARRMRHVACLAVHNVSTLSHKEHYFQKKKNIECKVYVLIFSTSFA